MRVDVSVNNRVIYMNSSSNKGNQMKWVKDGSYIKLDSLGYEGLAEWYVCKLLKYIALDGIDYVKYEHCTIYEDGEKLGFGCISKEFKEQGDEEVTVGKLIKQLALPFSIGYSDLRDELQDVTGLDIKNYFDTILCLDSITKNDDRHFYNISFLLNKGKYRFAPIYDNGSACLSDMLLYPEAVPMDKNIKRVLAKPFSVDFKRQINFVKRLVIDCDGFMQEVSKTDHRAVEVIKYGLAEMEGIAWERY